MKIIWFRHADEHRNDLLRFGLMRLHEAREIVYGEREFGACPDYGFAREVADKVPHHASVIAVVDGPTSIRCVVDSEDSFYWMSPLIAACDVFFCAGYNADFFKRKIFAGRYAWQRDHEVAFYKARSDELIASYGAHFDKVRPFVPIAPSLGDGYKRSYLQQKAANLRYRVVSRLADGRYWRDDLKSYERRHARLLQLRYEPLRYDVTLSDTLWGWPRHRVALHKALAAVSDRRAIHSRLSWSDPVPFDGSDKDPQDEAAFPMITGPIGDYETMLAASRLAVFATGFHWGWRSIMSLALMAGVPVLMDRPLLEPWFDLAALDVRFEEDATWSSLEATLESIGDRQWAERKLANAAAYDRVMSPEAVARYFLETATASR